MVGVYKITNEANGKVYIGQSIDMDERIKRHKRDLENSRSFCRELQHDYDKNPGNISFSILCECSVDELDDKEKGYIEMYDSTNPLNGYNKRVWGNWMTRTVSSETRRKLSDGKVGSKNPMYGYHPTEEELAERSERMKKHSAEISARMKGRFAGEKHPMYGKHHTEEAKEKMSAAKIGKKPWIAGKKHTEESLKKMSERRKGKMVGSANCKSKAVMCVETGIVYESQRIASRELNVNQSDISRSCKTGKATKGMHFVEVENGLG